MNVQTAAAVATVFTTVMITKIVRTRRATKRSAKDFEETVNSVNTMLQKVDVVYDIYVPTSA